jgi:hypothetical protein
MNGETELTETWRSVGDAASEMIVELVGMLDGLRKMPEPAAAVAADRMLMCWHAADKPERLEFAREVAEGLTDPQRAYLFVACFRAMSAEWRETVVNGMQAELLRAANSEGVN